MEPSETTDRRSSGPCAAARPAVPRVVWWFKTYCGALLALGLGVGIFELTRVCLNPDGFPPEQRERLGLLVPLTLLMLVCFAATRLFPERPSSWLWRLAFAVSLGIAAVVAVRFGLKALLGFLCLLAHCVGVFLPRRTWSWPFGLIPIALGLTWPCSVPLALALLVFWLRRNVRDYFGYSLSASLQRLRAFPWGWASLAAGASSGALLTWVYARSHGLEVTTDQPAQVGATPLLLWGLAAGLVVCGWIAGLAGVLLSRLRGRLSWLGVALNTVIGLAAIAYTVFVVLRMIVRSIGERPPGNLW